MLHPYTNMPEDGFEVVADKLYRSLRGEISRLGRTDADARFHNDVVDFYRIGSMSKQGGTIWS
jgi:hypothetical protein